MNFNTINLGPARSLQIYCIIFIISVIIYFKPNIYAQCISSGNQSDIQNSLNGIGAEAILCPDAVFELDDTIYFTADSQSIYTEGYPTDSTRAFLRIVGKNIAMAVSGEGNDYISLKNVIIDGNRPNLGIADGALINFGRGVEDHNVEGQVVEWVKAFEPRGWTIIYFGGPCRGALARNNELGPAGKAEYIIADGISLECPNSTIENNTIIDATDGGIVIFESPGSLIANNTIRAENRIMFYGISMEDYWPLDGNFTGTRVIGNIIDASGAMIRRGIGMGPYVGCANPEQDTLRSRGAVISGNTLMGSHMAYGFVVSGVEDWAVTDNVDLSTHLTPEEEGDCFGSVADHPSGFQYDSLTSNGTFQPEFEPAILGGSTEMFPLQAVVSEPCIRNIVGDGVFDDIKAGIQGEIWPALEATLNGELIDQCISIYEPPDISDLLGNVGLEVLNCEPSCLELRMFNLSDDTANLQRAEFLMDDFLVSCNGLPDSLGPWEEVHCTITDFVIPGFHVFTWYGFPGGGGKWVSSYPMETTAITSDDRKSPNPKSFSLSQNYPNPFNPMATINYYLPKESEISITIYNLLGKEICQLVSSVQPPGKHSIQWNGADYLGNPVSAGQYFYQIQAGDYIKSKKMILLK